MQKYLITFIPNQAKTRQTARQELDNEINHGRFNLRAGVDGVHKVEPNCFFAVKQRKM